MSPSGGVFSRATPLIHGRSSNQLRMRSSIWSRTSRNRSSCSSLAPSRCGRIFKRPVEDFQRAVEEPRTFRLEPLTNDDGVTNRRLTEELADTFRALSAEVDSDLCHHPVGERVDFPGSQPRAEGLEAMRGVPPEQGFGHLAPARIVRAQKEHNVLHRTSQRSGPCRYGKALFDHVEPCREQESTRSSCRRSRPKTSGSPSHIPRLPTRAPFPRGPRRCCAARTRRESETPTGSPATSGRRARRVRNRRGRRSP
jgi:hypothetical protein